MTQPNRQDRANARDQRDLPLPGAGVVSRKRPAAARRAAALAAWLAVAGQAPVGAAPAGPQVRPGQAVDVPANGDEFKPAPFHLYDTQIARVRAAEALDHIGAERWSEALAELQALIEDHRGEVLGAERPRPEDARLPSQMDVHAGAGMWAVRQLFQLPPEGQQLYRDRFGPRAADSLRRAIAASDRGALARVARRWPLTAAAERAWWALGDLEIELGHPADGIRAWARAAAIHVGQPMRTTIDDEDWKALRAAVAKAAGADDESGAPATPQAGALTRLDMAIELRESLTSAGSSKQTEASFVTGPAGGIAAQSLVVSTPFAGAAAEAPTGWETPYLVERGPFRDTNRLFPQRLGDTIFVNTSRSLHAIDAFDGEERWSLAAYDLGWADVRSSDMADFEEAIDQKERIVTVAASRGVVVAPIQIPWMYQESDQYNELSIIEVIPERRLLAVNAETGQELWNTLPPKGWNGDSGSFSERMTVVGPPTIVGARVLVPMAQLRGRIELHLGCFDLETGDVLWSSPLVTGQRTLNMFGRANIEFSAPPPVVVGDTAIVLTQLGIVAAVDIFTGETRWDTVYEQVPIKPPQYYSAGRLDNRWRNAPPVVTGETVVVTPFDGTSIFALDLDSGSMLWSREQRQLSEDLRVPSMRRQRHRVGGLDLLLAADDQRIVLGGSRITSINFPNGVRSGPRYHLDWTWPVEGSHNIASGVPVVDEGRIYVPGGQRILAIDRRSGLVVEEIPGQLGTGNLLVSQGMLFSSSGRQINARFQWRAMVERARAALEGPDGRAEDAATLVRLLLERAETTLGSGGPVREALSLLNEAKQVIVARAGLRSSGDEISPDARLLPGSSAAYESLRSDLFYIYLLRGQGERLRGDAPAARSAVTASLDLATSEAQEREALLTLHEIERSRDEAARRRTLAKLREPRHQRARISVRTSVPRGRWSGSATLGDVLEALDNGENADKAWKDPWGGAIYPADAMVRRQSKAAPVPGAFPSPNLGAKGDLYETRIECRLFAHLSEIELARELPTGSDGALQGELASLHAILREVPKENLFGVLSGDWARARIRALRVIYPLSPALERFEKDAEEMLEHAIVKARSPGGSPTLLDAIDRLYPGSRASERASDVRIEVALETGSAVDVAQIVVESLDVNWHPKSTSTREAELLAQLADTLGNEGNVDLKVGLMHNLARYSPNLEIAAPNGQKVTINALFTQWEAEKAARDGARERAQKSQKGFTNSAVKRNEFKGDFTLVAEGNVVKPGSDEAAGTEESLGHVAFFASGMRLMAFASGGAGEPLWQRPESLSITVSNRPARVTLHDSSWLIIQRGSQVACVDAATGKELWTFQKPGRTIGRIEVDGGMIVILTVEASSRDLADIHGLDAVKGLELWTLNDVGPSYHPSVKVKDGRLVMLPYNQTRAAVYDVYTGQPLATIQTGRINDRMARASWVDRDHLVIPYIEGGKNKDAVNAIVAYRLFDGAESWSVDLDRHAGGVKNLLGILDMPVEDSSGQLSGERVRVAMLESVNPNSSSGGLAPAPYGLHVLNERLGALDQRPLAMIESGARLISVNNRRREVLNSPLLIAVASGDATRQPTIRAIHPKFGRIWEVPAMRNLRVTAARSLPEPVVGDGTLALMASETLGSSGRTRSETKLMFLDASTGTLLETRALESGRNASDQREMAAFGSTLVLATRKKMEILE